MKDQNPDPVAAVVWPWRETRSTGHQHLSAGKVLFEAGLMLAAAALLYFGFQQRVIPVLIVVMATGVLIGGFLWRPLYDGFQRFGAWLATAVGVGLSWLLLVPFFYVCFSIGRVILKLRGADPLCRKWNAEADSYWVDLEPIRDEEHYRRQYETRGTKR